MPSAAGKFNVAKLSKEERDKIKQLLLEDDTRKEKVVGAAAAPKPAAPESAKEGAGDETGGTKLKHQEDYDSRVGWLYDDGKASNEDYLLGKKIGAVLPGETEDGDENKPPGATFHELTERQVIMDMQVKMREDPLFLIRQREDEAHKRIMANPVRARKFQQQEELRKILQEKIDAKVKRKEERRERARLKARAARLKREGGGDVKPDAADLKWHQKRNEERESKSAAKQQQRDRPVKRERDAKPLKRERSAAKDAVSASSDSEDGSGSDAEANELFNQYLAIANAGTNAAAAPPPDEKKNDDEDGDEKESSRRSETPERKYPPRKQPRGEMERRRKRQERKRSRSSSPEDVTWAARADENKHWRKQKSEESRERERTERRERRDQERRQVRGMKREPRSRSTSLDERRGRGDRRRSRSRSPRSRGDTSRKRHYRRSPRRSRTRSRSPRRRPHRARSHTSSRSRSRSRDRNPAPRNTRAAAGSKHQPIVVKEEPASGGEDGERRPAVRCGLNVDSDKHETAKERAEAVKDPTEHLSTAENFQNAAREARQNLMKKPALSNSERRSYGVAKGMSKEEREARLAEMQTNANWRDGQRHRKVEIAREEAEREATEDRPDKAEFVNAMLADHAEALTVESRIKRNIAGVQRTRLALDKNFTER